MLNIYFNIRNLIGLKDLNPIELVWNDLKYFLCTEIHPQNKNELINGILYFWRNKVDVEYCNKKIDHLDKVINKMILLKGRATGF